MEIKQVFVSEDLSYVRAEDDGLEVHVQRSDGAYYFEWSLNIEPQHNLEDLGRLNRPSALVRRENYDRTDIARYMEKTSDLSRHEIDWKLNEMRGFLEPDMDITTLQ